MWKWWQLYCILLHLCAWSSSQKTFLDSPLNLKFLRTFRNWAFDAFGRTGTEERYLQNARNANTVQETVPDHIPFPCNVTGGRSLTIPHSVHKLRPGDIDVIATMGDSMTAGAGIFATNVLQILVENRGVTAIGGGQGTWRQYLTLPNILKEFNPNLIGFALGDSLTSHKASQLNVAESGSVSEDMPYMAKILIKKIKSDPRINLQKHWKICLGIKYDTDGNECGLQLISLMIGVNDFCTEMCWIPSPWSILKKHKADMVQVLRTLRDNLPRTFVSLISPPHLRAFVNDRKDISSFPCLLTLNFECSCMFGLAFQRFRPMYYEIMKWWQELDMEIAAYPEFQTDDFVVVSQPILINAIVPLASDGYLDTTYLSSDCMHPTQKLNALIANGVWNNLLEPVGAKQTRLRDLFNTFQCPMPNKPYLTTMLNSKK